VKPPGLWGTEERLRELFGDGIAHLQTRQRTFLFRFRFPEEFAEFFRINYGPVGKAFEALDEPDQKRLWDDLVELARKHNRTSGNAVAIPAHYLEAIAVRR
jgi:hypothetical protein